MLFKKPTIKVKDKDFCIDYVSRVELSVMLEDSDIGKQ